jgi:regulator of protease activity HflC (stomatin/prohibitin superfamily)
MFLDYLYVLVILIVGIVSILGGIKNVPADQRLVVFRLGRALDKPKGPGLVFLLPILDHAISIDLKEQVRELPHDTATTKDFRVVSFSFRWYYKVLDPVKSVLEIGNHEAATAGVASTKLRELVHEVDSADLASERERIRYTVNSHLDKIIGQLGVKVTKFEILNIAVDDLN